MPLQTIKKEELFGKLDFSALYRNPDFKEDSVREVIILPILEALGYNESNIVRSKTLNHPFLKIGSNKKIPIKLIPDYCLKVQNNYAFVLDAKAPSEKVVDSENVEQVYSYATHPEIRATYFALCNGVEFSVYRTGSSNQPFLFFPVDRIEENWEKVKQLLSPDCFQLGKDYRYPVFHENIVPEVFDYTNRPLLEEIPVRKQAAKRHFGVHGYFTKQTWNVVAEYIKNYTQPGDMVLDPFGGSGVTPIEAMMNNRKAISIDLNPMAVFMVNSLLAPVNLSALKEEFIKIKEEYQNKEPKNLRQAKIILKKISYPQNIVLPKGSDVYSIEELFSIEQLAQLALLKSLIKKVRNKNIQASLMLAFSSTITKINLTYHNSSSRDENAGNAAVFAYYRYRIAKNTIELDLVNTFETKFNKLCNAKKEIEYYINEETIKNAQIIKGTATDLSWIPNESVDYIYTDPPYGSKIPYLDLSVMWNAWLDLEVSAKDRKLEAIEGGELNKSKTEYNSLISQSIKEMYRVLKYDRWLSFVFAHKDPEFWHLIIDTAESCGFEYVGAVPQKNGQTSFKKRQNPFTVLSGQLIINFRKVKNPRTILKANLGTDIEAIIIQTIEAIIAKNNGATLEQINDELIIKGLELGFLDLLKKQYTDLTPLLLNSFVYDSEKEIYTLKHDTKFRTKIDIRLRIKYYLLSYLRRMEMQNKTPHFDEIVLYIIPLLKNGITPEHQTILTVLEDIAERTGSDCWHLKSEVQLKLF